MSALALATAQPEAGAAPVGQSPFGDLSEAVIVTIDDEPIMSALLQTYLEEEGYRRVLTSNDPAGALQMLRGSQASLLLLDLMMPEVSGFDVLGAVRADPELRYLPVIILTAANDPENKLRALNLGATDFLSKPVDRSELVLRVRNSLGFRAYQDRLASIDALTGLANRSLLTRRLASAIEDATSMGTGFAVIRVDLDRFKDVNDSLGVSNGDLLLTIIGQRLEHCTRGTDFVGGSRSRNSAVLARFGGDDFTVLLPMLARPEDIEKAARRIIGELSKPVTLDDHELVITPSLGITIFPEDGTTAELMLANADAALAEAKQQGGNRHAFFSSALRAGSMARLTLGTQLRRALERDELILHYQPKVSLASGKVSGAEALVRWQLPGQGLVPPGKFIPLAEELGLIGAIGEWALREACSQLIAWQRDGMPPLPIAVNVSYAQFAEGAIVRAVQRALTEFSLPGSRLVLELTESMLMSNAGSTLQSLRELRTLDVQLSIDDFGTGYSSLSYLKHLPVNELKIDRSFLDESDRRANVAIIKAIVALARNLDMKVVAEGVETQAQLQLLQQLGCDVYQGFLCSPALAEAEFRALVHSINR